MGWLSSFRFLTLVTKISPEFECQCQRSRLLTLIFKLGRDFYTIHVTAKFHHPTFNRSEVIVQKRQTNKQKPLKTSTSLRYATPVSNNTDRTSNIRYSLSGQWLLVETWLIWDAVNEILVRWWVHCEALYASKYWCSAFYLHFPGGATLCFCRGLNSLGALWLPRYFLRMPEICDEMEHSVQCLLVSTCVFYIYNSITAR